MTHKEFLDPHDQDLEVVIMLGNGFNIFLFGDIIFADQIRLNILHVIQNLILVPFTNEFELIGVTDFAL